MLKYFAIDREGLTSLRGKHFPEVVSDVCRAIVELYGKTDYQPPFVCYLVADGEEIIGTCGFKSPPNFGRVEIAYFTFPRHEGRGLGTEMARELVRIARAEDPRILISAFTAPEKNASARILEQAGFVFQRPFDHPEDGLVWEWLNQP